MKLVILQARMTSGSCTRADEYNTPVGVYSEDKVNKAKELYLKSTLTCYFVKWVTTEVTLNEMPKG